MAKQDELAAMLETEIMELRKIGLAPIDEAIRIAAAVRSFMGSESPRHEGFAPCPTCRQYSHSIDGDALAKAYRHFETMTAHPVRGHPMGHVFDEATRDAAQVLMAAARAKEP